MNVLKNFEALFVVTLGVACAANYVMDSAEAEQSVTARAATAATVAYAAPQDMQVIVVSAKRLTAAQKLQSLRDERSASTQATSRI